MAIWGAISLQGPHHVANQSTTTTGFLAMVSLNASALGKDTVSIVGPESAVDVVTCSCRCRCSDWSPECARDEARSRGGWLLAACFCLLGDGNSRLNVVDSHLGQCGVE